MLLLVWTPLAVPNSKGTPVSVVDTRALPTTPTDETEVFPVQRPHAKTWPFDSVVLPLSAMLPPASEPAMNRSLEVALEFGMKDRSWFWLLMVPVKNLS